MADDRAPSFEELRLLFKEIGDKFKETAEQIKQLTIKVDRLTENIGGLSKKWGDFGEAMTVGESLHLFNNIEGIAVSSLNNRVRVNYNGKEFEFDGVAYGKEVAIVVEAKATLKKGDVTDFIKRKLKIFTKIDPLYKGKRIYGAMGFLSASPAAQAFAHARGLLLVRPTEMSKELVTPPEGFKLRDFHP